ncbi:hypothetical protein [Chicken microvirus mg4_76]|nr:hypothetical protein [Chicken microvirus mg4_76]
MVKSVKNEVFNSLFGITVSDKSLTFVPVERLSANNLRMKHFRSHRVGRNLSNKVGITPLERSDSYADSIHQLLHISSEFFILRQL